MNKSSSSSTQLGSVSSIDLIDAKLEEHQLCGYKQCPSCGHKLEAKPDWLGLPAGVKFDPTDQELIEHLEAKVQGKESKSHPLIDEFIPTIDGEDGICYTHPEKLPGVTRDGLSRHFFHRPSKAYTTGTRKRRKIQTETDLQRGETRWHKTGKTRPVMSNGNQKGCKKILVLYTNFGKNRKPEKTSWVMHQYHLGQHEEETEGELVVSKIFYQTQPRQSSWSDKSGTISRSSVREGSSCSSKDQKVAQRDEFGSANAVINVGTAVSSYGAMDIQQMKAHHFGYVPFRKTFDHEAVNMGEASMATENIGRTHEPTQQQQQQQIATSAFHVTRPSHSISAIVAPPQPSIHHTSNILDHHHSFHNINPAIMLHTQNFQNQQHLHQLQQHDHDHKVGGSPSSGLEELIMSCTATSSNTKQESSLINSQEAEWLKFSSTFWPDPDNPDHHG